MRYLPLLCLLSACMSGPGAVIEADLSQWRTIGAPVWRFDGGSTSAGPASASAFLLSRAEYSDFRLTVDVWLALQYAGNNKLQFRNVAVAPQ